MTFQISWGCDNSSERAKYLIDLVLTDVPDCAAKPCAAVADHRGVLTQVNFQIPETATHQREVWHFGDSDWERIVSSIEETSWKFLSATFPSEGAKRFTDELLRIAEENIPKRSASIRKTTHPWLNERCEEAIRRKHAAKRHGATGIGSARMQQYSAGGTLRLCLKNAIESGRSKAFVQKLVV